MRRRDFLSSVGIGLGVLSLGFDIGCGTSPIVNHAAQTGELAPNAWVTVRQDGRVVIQVEKAELGQGVTTMYATLVAEELDVRIEMVDAHYAEALPVYRTLQGLQYTGSSASTREAYPTIRRAAATAREMLVGAAAAIWSVPRGECKTQDGFVIHGNARLAYGDLTVRAAGEPVPEHPRLKRRAEFHLIGKYDRRVEIRSKVDGSAKYGMDTIVPGMVRAWVLHGPVFGANATKVEATKARVIRGIVDIFAFPGGVAVVAEKTWQAIAAARLVEVTWDRGLVAGLDTDKLRAAMRAYTSAGDQVKDIGDADKAIAGAATKLEVTYEGPYLCHAPMEPQNCIVHVRGKHVEVWGPLQSPNVVQSNIGAAIDVSPDDVVVHTTLVGGGFGRRATADFAVQAAHIAKRVGRPVQMTWSRASDMGQRIIGRSRRRACAAASGLDWTSTCLASHSSWTS